MQRNVCSNIDMVNQKEEYWRRRYMVHGFPFHCVSRYHGLTWKKVGELKNIVLICRYCFPKSMSLWHRKLKDLWWLFLYYFCLHWWVSFVAHSIINGRSKTLVDSNYLHEFLWLFGPFAVGFSFSCFLYV